MPKNLHRVNRPGPIEFHEWDATPRAQQVVAALGHDEIQVWTAALPAAAELDIRCLSPDERERAGRFRVSEPRRQFLFGRRCLRQLLGACLAADPAALMFAGEPQGKPFLVQSNATDSLRFNLSHSGAMVAIALARGRAVGVDIELMHPAEDWRLLSDRIFSGREQQEFNALPQSQQTQAFFNGWTRKEAYLKATGEGLIDLLAAIEVTLSPGQEPKLLALPTGAKAVATWSIHSVPLPPGYAGAVVFENV